MSELIKSDEFVLRVLESLRFIEKSYDEILLCDDYKTFRESMWSYKQGQAVGIQTMFNVLKENYIFDPIQCNSIDNLVKSITTLNIVEL